MNKKITLINQKGGVAKTTTTINLAYSLTEFEKRVLIIDLDPQHNLTDGVGFSTEDVKTTVYEILKNELPITDGIYQTQFDNLDIVPARDGLSNAEQELVNELGRMEILRSCFEKADDLKYDYILIDTQPSLGILPINSLVAADELIIPSTASKFSLNGMEKLTNLISKVRKKFNKNLKVRGVLLAKVDGRTNLGKEYETVLRKTFGDKLFDTVIHQNVKIEEAQEEGAPIGHYMPSARGSKEYKKVTKELLSNG